MDKQLKTGARVAICTPYYHTLTGPAADDRRHPCDPNGENQAVPYNCGDSFLARAFNQLWCLALNARGARKLTHFCMVHEDVAPGGYYVDIMLKEMRRYGADLVSV